MTYHVVHRPDGNRAELRRLWRDQGGSWLDIEHGGTAGAPDALVGLHGASVLVELKVGRAKLRPSQIAFQVAWRGCPICVVRTVDELLSMRRFLVRRAAFLSVVQHG